MPTSAQLERPYRAIYWLTYVMFQPIHLACIDERTGNLYVIAGIEESIEFQIMPNGEYFNDEPS